jgi:hypothetical protein
VGPDGKLQLVISNRQDMPEGFIDGKTFTSQGRHDNAGLIFYNSEGDEDGGLTFGSKIGPNGEKSADGGLLFDQYKQDQKIGLMYDQTDGKRSAGVRVWERPELDLAQEVESLHAMRAMPAGPAKDAKMKEFAAAQARGDYGAVRMFAGEAADQSAQVTLSDHAGHARLRLSVTPAGEASIEFLDASGKVVSRLPVGH